MNLIANKIRRTHMTTINDLGKRLSGFALAPFLGLAAPFIALPFIARASDAASWGAIAIGQSLGSFAMIVIGWGWSLTGPVEVARAPARDRKKILADATMTKILILLSVIPLLALVSSMYSSNGTYMLCYTTSIATGLLGLSHNWYAVGLGKPRLTIVYEVVPRIAVTTFAVTVVLLTKQVLYYPALLAVGSTATFAAFVYSNTSPKYLRGAFRRCLETLHSRRTAAATALSGGTYSALTIALVGIVVPAAEMAGYASIDKCYRIALLAIVTLTGTLQGWVAEKTSNNVSRRMLAVLTVYVLLGLAGLAGFSLLGPIITQNLFGSHLRSSEWESLAYGLTFLFVAVNTAIGTQILVPLGQVHAVLASTIGGAAIGLPAMLILGHSYGAVGGAFGFTIGEAVVAGIQAVLLRRVLRRSAEGIFVGGKPRICD